MNNETAILIVKIASMFLVIVVGYFARRRGYFTAETTAVISRFTTDIALPSLIFLQMIQTVDRQSLRGSWMTPLFAAAAINLGFLIAWLTWRFFATRPQAPTFIFVVGICNWIYLPLPIVDSLYHEKGLQQLLLANAAIFVVLWTIGVAVLHGGKIDRSSLQHLLRSPGLIATLLGLAVALLKPGPAGLPFAHASSTLVHYISTIFFESLKILGDVTISLSLIVTGAQLGAIHIAGQRPGRTIAGIILLRLVLVPLLMIPIAYAIQHSPWPMPPVGMMVGLLIAAMPVAVGSSIYTQRFNQNSQLAAQSILYTTLLSILTVPLYFSLAKHLLMK